MKLPLGTLSSSTAVHVRGTIWKLASIVALCILLPGITHAQDMQTQTQSITVSPTTTPITVEPGAAQLGSIKVRNNGDTAFDVHIYASPYGVSGINYDPTFIQLPGTTDAAQWVHFDTTASSLLPHSSLRVPYTLNVPPRTPPGGYYAVLFAESQPLPGPGVRTHNRVGNILYITVSGPVRMAGEARGAAIPRLTTASALPLSVDISNTGGAHFVTKTNISVSNIYNGEVYSASSRHYVLPQTVRRISTTWKTPAVGLYHVSRSATVAGKTKSLPRQWIVVIHPWVAIALALLGALGIILFTAPRRQQPKHPAALGHDKQ